MRYLRKAERPSKTPHKIRHFPYSKRCLLQHSLSGASNECFAMQNVPGGRNPRMAQSLVSRIPRCHAIRKHPLIEAYFLLLRKRTLVDAKRIARVSPKWFFCYFSGHGRNGPRVGLPTATFVVRGVGEPCTTSTSRSRSTGHLQELLLYEANMSICDKGLSTGFSIPPDTLYGRLASYSSGK